MALDDADGRYTARFFAQEGTASTFAALGVGVAQLHPLLRALHRPGAVISARPREARRAWVRLAIATR